MQNLTDLGLTAFLLDLRFIPTLDGTPPLGGRLSCIVLNLMAFGFCPALSGRWWHNDGRIGENLGAVELMVGMVGGIAECGEFVHGDVRPLVAK